MVKARHDEIQKIERDFVELAQLFQDLDTLVVQQEDAVQDIEVKGEEVTQNVGHANTQIDTAINSARSRRRKKWWCLLIAGECPLEYRLTAILRLMLLRSYHHHYHRRGRGCCCCGYEQQKRWRWRWELTDDLLYNTRIGPAILARTYAASTASWMFTCELS